MGFLKTSIRMTKEDFGRKLFQIRNAKGLTQDDLAKKCKITARTVQRIEAGTVTPRAFTIKLISETLEFDFFDSHYRLPEINSDNQKFNASRNRVTHFFKDLLNLKSNAMKKISILSLSLLLTSFFFAKILKTDAQSVPLDKTKNLSIELNKDNSISKVNAFFTNDLSLDELTEVKNKLAENGINIHYRSLEFDENGGLLGITCDVDCTDGFKGSFSIGMLNSINKDRRVGFVRNYSDDAETPFCTGGCNL